MVIGIHNSGCAEVQAIGNRAASVVLLSDLLTGALKSMDDCEKAAALTVLRNHLSEKGILGENIKMKIFYKNIEAPDAPVHLQELLVEMLEWLRKRTAEERTQKGDPV